MRFAFDPEGIRRSVREPPAKWLRLGTLDTPIVPGRRVHAWVSSKAEWFELADELPRYAEAAPKR